MRLIARYETAGLVGEPNWDRPDSLRWEDGTPATMEDFAARERGTESDPHPQYDAQGSEIAVEFGFSTRADVASR
jgi:hypothetical protein